MKINDITVTPLRIGKSLIRIQTDAGVEGWSEASGRNLSVFDAYLENRIKPALIGEDPRTIERHWTTLALGKDEVVFRLPGWAVGIIDVALWDLLGKETGLPVHMLMGGAARKIIPLYWSTGSGWRMQPEEMLRLVENGGARPPAPCANGVYSAGSNSYSATMLPKSTADTIVEVKTAGCSASPRLRCPMCQQ